MGFGSLIRSGVAIADKLTGGSDNLQDVVTIAPWIGTNDYGGPLYGTPLLIPAIVEERTYTRTMPSGDDITQRAVVTIPRPIAPNGAADRREPIDPRDSVVLPNGYTGPILSVEGPMDPNTHAPFIYTITLG